MFVSVNPIGPYEIRLLCIYDHYTGRQACRVGKRIEPRIQEEKFVIPEWTLEKSSLTKGGRFGILTSIPIEVRA